VDQVVVENGIRPNEELYYALKQDSCNKGQLDNEALFEAAPQPVLALSDEEKQGNMILWRLGDCVSQRNTHAAIYDALRLCKDL
ncbi:MAG: N-methylproline demethylase, partial [Pseudomonadales bacterium]